ncbi:uncharacterized protein K02A2.6-like [Sabethes cyaneus]|uniref:uncharacterized protein K02A2.6-like n=1 Tax=Sabethes cyaneus TaxID=53552 RepID=UPI00237E62C9|nr:uncharacterized protein K02A2.6-like [Sabethes cyaneus]
MRAKQQLFWIGMSNDIQNMVQTCPICEKYQKSNQKYEILSNEIPSLPFEIVGSDFFHFQGHEYLLIADSYSGYFDFVKLDHTSSKTTIEQMKKWFANFGIPRILYTDNGPQYSSKEFADFSKCWSFNHVTSSPHFPRSNGLAERFVQTAKALQKKCTEDGSDVQMPLLHMRNTPRDSKLLSPSLRLMSRTLRSNIPATTESLKPRLVDKVSQNLHQEREKQRMYSDKGSATSATFRTGQEVVIQNNNSRLWERGTVLKEQPRSYKVQLSEGPVLRRNIRDIKAAKGILADTQKDTDPPLQNNNPRSTEEKFESNEADIPANHQSDQAAIIDGPTFTRSGRAVRMRRLSDYVYE